MQLLIDFLPIVLFFLVYKLAGIYAATAAAIAAALAQVAYLKARRRPVPRMLIVSTALLALLGGLTLILRDEMFIMWKPSLVNWLFAAVFLGSLATRRSILERMLGGELHLPGTVFRRLTAAWTLFFVLAGALNAYVAFGYQVRAENLNTDQRATYEAVATDADAYSRAVLGTPLAALDSAGRQAAAGLDAQARRDAYLAKLHRDRWVNFKLFGLLGLTLIFALAQGVYLARQIGRLPADGLAGAGGHAR